MSRARILVIDDEALMREYVEEALTRAGYEVTAVGSGRAGIDALSRTGFDAVVTDFKMTPMDGLEVVRQTLADWPETRCIVMTAYGTIESAVEALKLGADDYILKPFEVDELELAVARALEHGRLTRENRYLRAELDTHYNHGVMVGQSAAMRDVYAQLGKVSNSRATILIRGESGTGKELAAHAIHHGGNRKQRPFIRVNCAALSAGLLESELFGHEKGAFTGAHDRKIGRFELADGGTLLLDEISEISPDLQPKLLRALQEREFERVGGNHPIQTDTRIIATSNRDLERAVAEGKFREDLFFRLNVIQIHLPALRVRKEDIPGLMDHFLERYARENGRAIEGFTADARAAFTAYDWPGNVRELQNAIERGVVLSDDPVLGPEHFLLESVRARKAGGGITAGMTVSQMEKELILKTLDLCQQNRTRAAKTLGISVRTLRNKLKEYRESCEL